MNMDTEESVILPRAELKEVASGVSLLPPLTRKGFGPGLIIVLPRETPNYAGGGALCENGVPPPLLKWAEEGFAVVQILEASFDGDIDLTQIFQIAIDQLSLCQQCSEGDGIGLIVYDLNLWTRVSLNHTLPPQIKAAVLYGSAQETSTKILPVPSVHHLTGSVSPMSTKIQDLSTYNYPTVKSPMFPIPGLDSFESSSEAVAHTRNLTFLKRHIKGLNFDLETIWEEHCYWEFENRSVAKTMGTMVQEPYVNHIPTITGGIGRDLLTDFYRNHFIFTNPADTETELVSRTIGIDRVCDEFIFKFTHDHEVDWLIPGIPPTGKRLQIAFTAVVNIRGDRLYHEHIAWDQASVLVQLGLMPEYLSFPYPLKDGTKPKPGKKFEYRVPAAGIETVQKMLDKNGVKSNEMFAYRIREVDASLTVPKL